jgi:hypothetical protein
MIATTITVLKSMIVVIIDAAERTEITGHSGNVPLIDRGRLSKGALILKRV